MSDRDRSVHQHLREYPITDAERAQIERARAGDLRGLWRRVDGRWERL